MPIQFPPVAGVGSTYTDNKGSWVFNGISWDMVCCDSCATGAISSVTCPSPTILIDSDFTSWSHPSNLEYTPGVGGNTFTQNVLTTGGYPGARLQNIITSTTDYHLVTTVNPTPPPDNLFTHNTAGGYLLNLYNGHSYTYLVTQALLSLEMRLSYLVEIDSALGNDTRVGMCLEVGGTLYLAPQDFVVLKYSDGHKWSNAVVNFISLADFYPLVAGVLGTTALTQADVATAGGATLGFFYANKPLPDAGIAATIKASFDNVTFVLHYGCYSNGNVLQPATDLDLFSGSAYTLSAPFSNITATSPGVDSKLSNNANLLNIISRDFSISMEFAPSGISFTAGARYILFCETVSNANTTSPILQGLIQMSPNGIPSIVIVAGALNAISILINIPCSFADITAMQLLYLVRRGGNLALYLNNRLLQLVPDTTSINAPAAKKSLWIGGDGIGSSGTAFKGKIQSFAMVLLSGF